MASRPSRRRPARAAGPGPRRRRRSVHAQLAGGQWRAAAANADLAAEAFTHPGAGNFYTDSQLADCHAPFARFTWQRVTTFLSALLAMPASHSST